MKLSDLITENVAEEEVVDVLFEEDELNEVFTGKRYNTSNFSGDVDKFVSKTGQKGNPFKGLLKTYGNPIGTIDPAQSVKGLSNASELLGMIGGYREHAKQVQKLADDFDKFKSEMKTKVSRITDDDKATHKSMPKTVKEQLNKFYSQYKHYAKLLPKEHTKARGFNPAVSAAKRKTEIKGNVAQTKANNAAARKEATDKFKSNVKGKVSGVQAGAKKFGSDFKNKAKAMAKGVNFKADSKKVNEEADDE